MPNEKYGAVKGRLGLLSLVPVKNERREVREVRIEISFT